MGIVGSNIYGVKEVSLHKGAVALGMISRNANVLIQIKTHAAFKTEAPINIAASELLI